MAIRVKALFTVFACTFGAMAVVPAAGAASGGRPQEITVTVIGPPGSDAIDLSERGHVAYSWSSDRWEDESGAYRWYRGESVRLSPDVLPGVSSASSSAVNRWGSVVGNTWDVGVNGAWGFEWRHGAYTPLPPRPGSSFSSTDDINDLGVVLLRRGEGDCCSPTWQAAVRFGDHEVTSPLIPGRRPLVGTALNNWGTVIGYSLDQENRYVAFRWQPGTDPVPLLPEGATGSQVYGINDRGTVLGRANKTFLWRHGRFTDVGLEVPEALVARPDRLNNRDEVVGYVFDDSGFRAALWSRGRLIELGHLGGGYSEALGINDRGEVVGRSSRADGSLGAFLWRDGTMIDLGASTGAPRSEALAINNRGQVLGQTTLGDDYSTRQPVLWETRRH